MSKEMREQINKVKNWKQFLNENKNIEPYYNNDFKQKIETFLLKLGYEDIEFEVDGIDFHNPDYDDRLTNKNAHIIIDFINDYGYDADDFGVYGNRIMYPSNF